MHSVRKYVLNHYGKFCAKYPMVSGKLQSSYAHNLSFMLFVAGWRLVKIVLFISAIDTFI